MIFLKLYSSDIKYNSDFNTGLSHGPIGFTSISKGYIHNYHLNFHVLPFVAKNFLVGGVFGIGIFSIGTLTGGIEGKYYYRFLSFNLLASYQILKNNDFKFYYHYLCINPGVSVRIKTAENLEPVQKGKDVFPPSEEGIIITISKGIVLSSRTEPGRLSELMPPYLLNFEVGLYSMGFK
jgi:hypothetical protein